MNRTTGIFMAIAACAILAALVFSLTDLLGGRAYASPEEVFQASVVAVQRNDLSAWCHCLTDDSRDLTVVKDVEFFLKIKLEDAKEKSKIDMLRSLAELQKKYGLTEEHLAPFQQASFEMNKAPIEARLRFADKVLAPLSPNDRCAFFGEVWSVKLKDPDGPNPFMGWADAKLTKVRKTGKSAAGLVTAMISTPTGAKEHATPMFFRQEGDGWRIDLLADEPQLPAQPGFGHP
jgi:hypothetical protein